MTRSRPLTLADLSEGQRSHVETCVHEAGHAVAGVVLGARLRSAAVSLSRVDGLAGLTSFDHRDHPQWHDPAIAYAGGYAQARFRAGGHRQPTARALSAVFSTSGCHDAAMMSLAGGTHLGHGARNLVDRCWPAVIRVAQHLHREREARHADILAALNVTDGGGRTSVELAAIRSGAVIHA